MHRLFDIVPYGDRWSVSSRGEPMIVTRTRAAARRLAAEALASLRAARPQPPRQAQAPRAPHAGPRPA